MMYDAPVVLCVALYVDFFTRGYSCGVVTTGICENGEGVPRLLASGLLNMNDGDPIRSVVDTLPPQNKS